MANQGLDHTSVLEEQLLQLKSKFSGLEKHLSFKANERIFSMALSHRKEMEDLKAKIKGVQHKIEFIERPSRKTIPSDLNKHIS